MACSCETELLPCGKLPELDLIFCLDAQGITIGGEYQRANPVRVVQNFIEEGISLNFQNPADSCRLNEMVDYALAYSARPAISKMRSTIWIMVRSGIGSIDPKLAFETYISLFECLRIRIKICQAGLRRKRFD